MRLEKQKKPTPLIAGWAFFVVEMPGVEPGSEWSNMQTSTCVAGLFACRYDGKPTVSGTFIA